MIPVSLIVALAATPIVYVSTSGITWPQGRLVVQGMPGAKVPKISDAREPSLSPDRTRVLYWANPKDADAENPIKELNLKTGTIRIIAPGNCRTPVWSADGKTILFTEFGKDWILMSVPSDGSSQPKRVFSTDGLFKPNRSFGSGEVLVQDMSYVYWLTPGGEVKRKIAIANIATRATAISSGDRFVAKPGASQILAYSQEAYGHKTVVDQATGLVGAIFTYDVQRGTRTRITPPTIYASDPSWSRDGTLIYFVAHRKKGSDVMCVRATGGRPTLVVKNAGEFSL